MIENFLVVGGSGGIGAATCMRLAEIGYRPIVTYGSNRKAALMIAERCGGRLLALDLANHTSIAEVVENMASYPEPLAGVILAASPTPVIAPFRKITEENMQLQWQVTVAGPQRLLAGLVSGCLRKRKKGTIIGILTEAMGDTQRPAWRQCGAYVIAKFGLLGLLAVLAAEYPWLRVGSVKPGYTETKMLQVFDRRFLDMMREKKKFQAPDEVAQEIIKQIPSPGKAS